MERSSSRRRRSSSKSRSKSPIRRDRRGRISEEREKRHTRNRDEAESKSTHARSRSRSRSRDRSRDRDRGRGSTRGGDGAAGDHPLLRDAHQQPRMVWGNPEAEEPEPEPEEAVEKHKPDFGLSGALAKDTQFGNVKNGVILKWSEPVDARTPSIAWRMYVFKGREMVDTLYIYRQIIQFRYTDKKGVKAVRPYIMDLESTNGTFLNGNRIESSKYVELLEKDVLKFGESTREYVLLHDKSA